MESRLRNMARLVVHTSTKVKRGDNVLIQIVDEGRDLATEIYREVANVGGQPLIITTPSEAVRAFYEVADEETLTAMPRHYLELVKASDVIISIRSNSNTKSLSNVQPKKISGRSKALKTLQEERLSKRWCLTQYPTVGYAQDAEMSLREYEDFVYSAILIDWDEQIKTMQRLKEVMDTIDEVRLIGDETDLTMSILGRNAVVGGPTLNVPGGEVFTAPIEDSAEGTIFFDLPAVVYGKAVEGVKLTFTRGEVVEYSARRNEALLKSMIETDEGARRLGELGIGTNMGIQKFTKNILFDEKIGGTIHLALGRAYPECGGVNESAIHWDMIKTMDASKGHKILFDGQVLRRNKDGTWSLLQP
ncbi:MAG: aminopeptidase [Candidatus Bathyarchaeota archaeon]|nr:aminopeptidase [Candidatus Bathyarchaeota archaeon]